MGSRIPLFCTSGDISSGFQSQSGQRLFQLGRGICVTWFMRFTSGATPADLLVASMAAEPFSSTWHFYCLQRSCGKVMFSQVCVKNSVYRGGVHGRGHAWRGGMCGRGHVWGKGHAWQCYLGKRHSGTLVIIYPLLCNISLNIRVKQ